MPKINGGFATSFVVIAASFGNAAAICGPGVCTDDVTWSTYSISVQVGKCFNGTVCGYRCQQNYYGTGSACSKCPSYLSIEGITSGPGTTDITSCYISKDATITDVTGQYTVFAQDCYYTETSAPNPPYWSSQEIQKKITGNSERKLECEYTRSRIHVRNQVGRYMDFHRRRQFGRGRIYNGHRRGIWYRSAR